MELGQAQKRGIATGMRKKIFVFLGLTPTAKAKLTSELFFQALQLVPAFLGLRPATRSRTSARKSAAAQGKSQHHDEQNNDQNRKNVFHGVSPWLHHVRANHAESLRCSR